ncbi:hypothetical protein BJ085DRAFT_33030 [Dimargaris cristalligena]|uniref:ASTRA-associated protein 1 n=1 Tax=Dimargaris cristalligena TaxID=215637 RepID=A0A4P9ZTV1_9FUNG|nr:hypothetical protein BJ085DRAFT_33030 [Dimargaris cristalligena]|eukprot:RKP36937.1 hypothetical protein BJ085DRAFT_33030 [Dimargaris cristalligena]
MGREFETLSTFSFTTPQEHGLCMCLRLVPPVQQSDSSEPHFPSLLTAHEGGQVSLWAIVHQSVTLVWSQVLHSEPVLCMDIDSTATFGCTGSADDRIVRFRIHNRIEPTIPATLPPDQIDSVAELSQPGTADIRIRSDGNIIIAAGWDAQIRVLHAQTLTTLAVLSNHRELVHCLAVPDILPNQVSGIPVPSGQEADASGTVVRPGLHSASSAKEAGEEGQLDYGDGTDHQVANGNTDPSLLIPAQPSSSNYNSANAPVSVMIGCDETQACSNSLTHRPPPAPVETNLIAAGSKDKKITLWRIY